MESKEQTSKDRRDRGMSHLDFEIYALISSPDRLQRTGETGGREAAFFVRRGKRRKGGRNLKMGRDDERERRGLKGRRRTKGN